MDKMTNAEYQKKWRAQNPDKVKKYREKNMLHAKLSDSCYKILLKWVEVFDTTKTDIIEKALKCFDKHIKYKK